MNVVAWLGRGCLVAVVLLTLRERQSSGLELPQRAERAEPQIRKTVGTITYRGPHSWGGMIEISSSAVEFRDGVVSATSTGIPQGVVVQGKPHGVTLTNLTFTGVGDAINVGNGHSVSDLMIDSCKFLECRTPDVSTKDPLVSGRGYGIFGSAGRNWTIRNSVFQTKPCAAATADAECLSQYAARLGEVIGLNVHNTRFENCGKPVVWLMFVRAASFTQCEFSGGPFRIGVRANDLPDVETGDCRNIVFRNCTFRFGSYQNWPAGILVFPGSQNITFEDCTIVTTAGSDWWLEIDPVQTSNVTWKNCTWNGEPVMGFRGVRSKLSIEEMKQRGIQPAEDANATPTEGG